MSEENSRSSADELTAQLSAFIAELAEAGYSKKTQLDKQRLIMPFIRRCPRTDSIDGKVDAFLAHRSGRRYGQRRALQQFLVYLRRVGAVPPIESQPSSADILLRKYVDYLRDKQGLTYHSVAVYSPFARRFIIAHRLPIAVAKLDGPAIHRHLVEQSRCRSSSYVRLLAASLRSFLRFCFVDGITAGDLSTFVLPVRRYQLAGIPALLTAQQVEHVIAVAADNRSTTAGIRAFAIVLLLARLGLRAGEVVGLELDDIRWDAGEIVVRGKGRFHDRLPLPHDVGGALARYIRDARGASASRRVFLRHIAPRVGILRPCIVCQTARAALQRAGVLPAGRVGAHIFRHSLATRMIRSGASLPDISQVLRHRSTVSTQLYTKVDLEALRAVALPWPSAEVRR